MRPVQVARGPSATSAGTGALLVLIRFALCARVVRPVRRPEDRFRYFSRLLDVVLSACRGSRQRRRFCGTSALEGRGRRRIPGDVRGWGLRGNFRRRGGFRCRRSRWRRRRRGRWRLLVGDAPDGLPRQCRRVDHPHPGKVHPVLLHGAVDRHEDVLPVDPVRVAVSRGCVEGGRGGGMIEDDCEGGR